MHELQLGHGLVAIVSPEDADLAVMAWHAAKRGRTTYAERTFRRSDGRCKTEGLHRVIAARMGLEITGLLVDHINGDGLDCRRENLRIATRAQNQHNRRRSVANTSGYKGVFFDKRAGRWRAAISLDGRLRYLGSFTSAAQAGAAYDTAARTLHGEFAHPAPNEVTT